MKIASKIQLLLVVGIALAYVAAPMHHANAQRQSWNTSYIAEDTFFHAGLNVESLLQMEPADSDLRKMIAEGIEEEMGIKIDDLKQVQFLLGGESVNDMEDIFQAKLTFNKEQDFERLKEELFHGRFEEAEHNGKKYFKNERDRSPSAYMPDAQTVIIANSVRLTALMDSESGRGEIVDMLSDAEGIANAFIAFKYTDQLDEVVAELAEEIRGLPFDIHDIASEAESGHLTVILDSDEPLSASIKAKDADGAERLKRTIDALIGLGKFGIPQARKQLDSIPEADDEEAMEQIKEMKKQATKGLDTADAILEGATVETNGVNLEIRTKVMGGAAEGIRALLRTGIMGMTVRSAAPRVDAVEADAVEAVEDFERAIEKE